MAPRLDTLERKAALSLALLVNPNSSSDEESEGLAFTDGSPIKKRRTEMALPSIKDLVKSTSPDSSRATTPVASDAERPEEVKEQKGKRSRFNDDLWMKHYSELKQFKQNFGHCNVTQVRTQACHQVLIRL
jgi:hypothetical protein